MNRTTTLVLATLVVGTGQSFATILPAQEEAEPTQPAYFPDPDEELQWAIENTGQLGGLADADIDVRGALSQAGATENVLVAVMDTGIDLTHPELASQIWTNEVELNGISGEDDDQNGCVDDIHGCNFSLGCGPETPNCSSQPTGEVYDINGHGTAVAGIIGAAADGQGVIGVAPGVRLVALQVGTDTDGYFWDTPVDRAIQYAIDIGVDIINISAYFDGYDLALQEAALTRAREAGVLVVAAAGNWGVNLEEHRGDLPYLPGQSDDPLLVQVAAVDQYETLISYAGWWGSCYGPNQVEIAGPSQAITTTYPVRSGSYTYDFNGTSAATPFVAGVAALIWATDPGLSAEQVREILLETAEPLPALKGKISTGGRVHAANAVARALAGSRRSPPVAVMEAPDEVDAGEEFELDGRDSASEEGTLVGWRWYFDEVEAGGERITTRLDGVGDHIITLEVEDDQGNRRSTRSVVTVPYTWQSQSYHLSSAHPYAEGLSDRVEVEGASWVRFHFSRLELFMEDDDFVATDDAVLIRDPSGTAVWSTSVSGTDFWTPALRGSEFQISLISRTGGTWGMDIDGMEVARAADEEPGSGGCNHRGEGGAGQGLLAVVLLLLRVSGWTSRASPPAPGGRRVLGPG